MLGQTTLKMSAEGHRCLIVNLNILVSLLGIQASQANLLAALHRCSMRGKVFAAEMASTAYLIAELITIQAIASFSLVGSRSYPRATRVTTRFRRYSKCFVQRLSSLCDGEQNNQIKWYP